MTEMPGRFSQLIEARRIKKFLDYRNVPELRVWKKRSVLGFIAALNGDEIIPDNDTLVYRSCILPCSKRQSQQRNAVSSLQVCGY